jgi:hypothetical protein
VSRPRTRVGRRQTGERLGGFIYGTIVVLAVIVAGARAWEHEAGHIAGLVAVTVLVFWLAHVYANALAHSVAHDEHLSLAELRRIAHREASILEAAVPPLVALLLGAFGIVSTKLSVWVAFGLGLVVLCAQGITFARVEGMGRLGTLAVVAANLGLGVALVGLKLLVSH